MIYQHYKITKIEEANVSQERHTHESGYLITVVFIRQNDFTCTFKLSSDGYPSEEKIIEFLNVKMQEIGRNLFVN